MTKRTSILIIMTLAVGLAPATGFAQLAQSTFNSGTEDWVSVILPYPSAIPPNVVASFTPTWEAAGGGRLYMFDPDGTGAGNTEYWQAPPAFLGAKSGAYGGTLEFDLADQGSGYPPYAQEDLILVGGGLTLVATLPTPPTGVLGHFAVNLTEAGWKRGGLAGPDATRAEFQAVLANLTLLYIRAEFQLGPDHQYLDNVIMTGGAAAVGPVAGAGFVLEHCTPNPFNPSTMITLDVAQADVIRIDIVDVSGRLVRHLRHGALETGRHQLRWDGTDDRGRRAASGTYFCRASAGDEVRMQGMVLLK